jgi:hypothetical protein
MALAVAGEECVSGREVAAAVVGGTEVSDLIRSPVVVGLAEWLTSAVPGFVVQAGAQMSGMTTQSTRRRDPLTVLASTRDPTT